MATPAINTTLLTQADGSNLAPYYDAIVPAMNALAAMYAVDTVLRLAHLLAQIGPADAKDFVALPDLLVGTQKYGVESAFFFWDARNLNAMADGDDISAVTVAINGGDNGLDDRKLRLARIKHALGA